MDTLVIKRSPSKYEEEKLEIGMARGLRTISEEIHEPSPKRMNIIQTVDAEKIRMKLG